MKISSIFKAELHTRIIAMYSTTCKRRPMKLDIDEGIDCLFRIVRTGMQWREIEVKSASISALFKHVHRWVKAGVIQDAYTSMLHSYASRNDEKYYIIDTPEHYTSKTCSKCFHECGAFRELELQRRKEAKSHAKTPEEEKRASRLTIRSIRRCQNEKCGVILNRDRNAASNIATNFKLLFQGQSPLRKQIATEQQLEKLKCSICNA